MNSKQKAYYRYKYEQKLPKVIQHNLKPVSVHEVVNSKVESYFSMRGTCHRELHWFAEGFITVEQLVTTALERNNVKLMRLCYKHYKDVFLRFSRTVIPRNYTHIPNIRNIYKPFITYRGYKYALSKYDSDHLNKACNQSRV